MDLVIRKYLAEIGRMGGKKSKRVLAPDLARTMVRVREARRAFRKFRSQCFWSYAPDYKISAEDLSWVATELMKHGGREAWHLGAKLCR